jgi:hypothetical protein
MKRFILLSISGLMLSGCFLTDIGPPHFFVTNKTAQTLVVGPGDGNPDETTKRVASGETVFFDPDTEGCGSRLWVAANASGEALADNSGGCVGHTWTIRGLNDSTYECTDPRCGTIEVPR